MVAMIPRDKGRDAPPAPPYIPPTGPIYAPSNVPPPVFDKPSSFIVTPAPSKKSSTSSTGTVSSGGGYGGGGGYNSFSASPPPPPPMSIADWLNQDATYQAQVAAMAKALTDYKAQMGHAQGVYNNDYASRVNDWQLNKQRSTEDQANDYASRGMFISGLYGRANSDLLGDFARRRSDMDTARANYLAGLQTDLANFQDQQQLDQTKAKQDAINRRAMQYGI